MTDPSFQPAGVAESGPMHNPGPGRAPAGASLTARTFSGMVWGTIAFVVSKLLSLVQTLVVASLLPKEAFGLFTIAMIVGLSAVLFRDAGVAQTLTRRGAELDKLQYAGFWLATAAGMLAAVGTWIAIPFAVNFYGRTDLILPTLLCTLPLPLTGVLAVAMARLNYQLEYRYIANNSTRFVVLAFVLTVVMAVLNTGVYALIVPQAICSILRPLVLWRRAGLKIGWRLDLQHWGPLLRESILLLLLQGIMSINWSIDRIVMAYRGIADRQLGEYQFALLLATQTSQLFNTSVGTMLLASFAHLQHDKPRREAAFLRTVRLLSAAAFPASVLQVILIPPALELFFGGKWFEAGVLAQVMTIGMAFTMLSTPVLSFLQSTGKLMTLLVWNLVVTAITISFVLVGVAWGPLGAAAAMAMVAILTGPAALWLALGRTARGTVEVARVLGRPLFATTLSAGLTLAVVHLKHLGLSHQLIQLPSLTLIFCVIHLLALNLLQRAELREWLRLADPYVHKANSLLRR